MTIISDTGLLLPEDSENKLAWFEDDYGLYGYIDKDGKVIIPPIYHHSTSFRLINGKMRAIVGNDETGGILGYGYRLINEKGEFVSQFYSEMKFDGDLIIVKRGGKYGTIDENGKVKDNIIFEEIKNGIGKVVYNKGKYKGYERYFFLSGGQAKSSDYGQAIYRVGHMSTQKIPSLCNRYREGRTYFHQKCNYDKKVFVDLNSNKILEGYEVITDFKEINEEDVWYPLHRAIARKIDTDQICLINDYAGRLLNFPSKEYHIEETLFNMYIVTERKTGFKTLYDCHGERVIHESADIKVMPCGLILVKDKKGVKCIYTYKGLLLRVLVDYTSIEGKLDDKTLVANYISDDKLKNELIDSNGNAIKFNFDYDYASNYVNGCAILSKDEVDYTMNSPYEYKKHYIVNRDKNVVLTYPKDDIIKSFSNIQNYADKGFFIGEYQNTERFSVFDLKGNVLFEVDCMNLKYENGLFVAKIDVFGYIAYEFYDKNGCNIFESKYCCCPDCFFYSYDFIGDKSLVLYKGLNSYFVNFENKDIDLSGWEYEDSRVLSEMLKSKDMILIEDRQDRKYSVNSYHVAYKKFCMYKVNYNNTYAIFDNYGDHKIIKEEYRDLLMYFDLSEVDFTNVDVRGIDFSNTNAKINANAVYMRSLDGCNLKHSNFDSCNQLIKHCYDTAKGEFSLVHIALDRDVSLVGTIIDGKILDNNNLKEFTNDDLSRKLIIR